MTHDFLSAWLCNGLKLKRWFEANKQSEYDSYQKILYKIIEIVINPYLKEYANYELDPSKIHEIDDGDYQGTLIYLIPYDTYQPSINEYILTAVEYGSCSACDTLLRISKYDEDKPSKEQVHDYMLLALHMVQNCRKLGGCFRFDID